jgi:hypothetical protein
MTRLHRLSGQLSYGPAPKRLIHGSAHPSPQAPGEDPLAHASASRLSRGNVQALRSPWLSLRPWARPRAKALSVSQRDWTAPPPDLRVAGCPWPSRGVPRQLPRVARGAQRDLRDQHRTAPPPRGSRVGRHGAGASPGGGRARLRQSGRHPRRHDRFLSRRGCPAIRCGGAQ